MELTRALAARGEVGRVDLLTRQIFDRKVDAGYAEPNESLATGANLIRLPCGPRRYLRKEVLWPHLDSFADHALQYIRQVGRVPDIIHAHYADAGYVGAQLSSLLGVPLIFTGHSLGRDKMRRLHDRGAKISTIENQYKIRQRIEAEEQTLENATMIVASTQQEVRDQYADYDNYQPERINVIPPGIDLSRFCPPRKKAQRSSIQANVDRFLKAPEKPMILAIARADERKNLGNLVKAYGESPKLRSIANLVIVAGNRDVVARMDKGARKVLVSLLALIDGYDLYGSVAYPKHHQPEDIPLLYQLAAQRRGVFVNPALTEPFGLTLIESAASGLPIVATNDGGPTDIIRHCNNGLLIDPLDTHGIADALITAMEDAAQWHRWSSNGVDGVHRHFSWPGHAKSYIKAITKLAETQETLTPLRKNRLPTVDRMLVCDIDGTLLGDRLGLNQLLNEIRSSRHPVGFGVATGRNINSTLEVLDEWKLPIPDVMITCVGSEIYYGEQITKDKTWSRQIDYRWDPIALRQIMKRFKGLKLQSRDSQRPYKISYDVDPKKMPSVREIVHALRLQNLHAKVIYSHQAYLDLLPIRASKGLAMRYLGMKWGLAPERFLVAGDSGNDEEMLCGDTLGVVVGNYSPELDRLRGRSRIFFSDNEYANGIVDGMNYYDFLGDIQVPDDEGKTT